MSAWNGVYEDNLSFDDLDEDDCDHVGLGCSNCDSGWVHGCCDDLCRGSRGGPDCQSALACRACNPEGDIA